MTIIQGATLTGLDHVNVRPGAKTRSAEINQLLVDSAACYETLTGYAVPNAAGLAATPHVHDGTNGALVRLPLAHGANWKMILPARSGVPTSGGTDYSGFYPVTWAPFYAPTGVDEVMVLLFLKTPAGAQDFQVAIQNTSLANTDVQGPGDGFLSGADTDTNVYAWLHPNVGEYVTRGFSMSCTAGAVNVLKVNAWDGKYDHTYSSGGGIGQPDVESRTLRGYAVIPVVRKPPGVLARIAPSVTTTATHRLPASNTYVSVDSDLVTDDRAIPSYLLVTQHKNECLLIEATTGQPAANRPSVTVAGHNHQEVGTASALNTSGADMEHALGSWAYGVLRPPVDIGTAGEANGYSAEDMPKSDFTFVNDWLGVPMAPVIDQVNATSSTFYTVFEHVFRMPAISDLTGAGGHIKAAALVYNDTSTMNVRLSIGDSSGSYASAVTTSAGSGGRQLITFSGLTSGGRDSIRRLKVEMSINTAKGSYGDTTGIYGVCLYYDG